MKTKRLVFAGAAHEDYPENGGLHIGGKSVSCEVENFIRDSMSEEDREKLRGLREHGGGCPRDFPRMRVEITISMEDKGQVFTLSDLTDVQREVYLAMVKLHRMDGPGAMFGPTKIGLTAGFKKCGAASKCNAPLKRLIELGFVRKHYIDGLYQICNELPE